MPNRKIFVSHSHIDIVFCRQLVEGLRHAGGDVWYDEHDLGFGQLRKVIERELKARSIFIVILSPAALHSHWVEDESDWFFQLYRSDSSRIILPVMAQDITEDDIWLFLSSFKRVAKDGIKALTVEQALQYIIKVLALSPPITPADTILTGAANITTGMSKAQSAEPTQVIAVPVANDVSQGDTSSHKQLSKARGISRRVGILAVVVIATILSILLVTFRPGQAKHASTTGLHPTATASAQPTATPTPNPTPNPYPTFSFIAPGCEKDNPLTTGVWEYYPQSQSGAPLGHPTCSNNTAIYQDPKGLGNIIYTFPSNALISRSYTIQFTLANLPANDCIYLLVQSDAYDTCSSGYYSLKHQGRSFPDSNGYTASANAYNVAISYKVATANGKTSANMALTIGGQTLTNIDTQPDASPPPNLTLQFSNDKGLLAPCDMTIAHFVFTSVK